MQTMKSLEQRTGFGQNAVHPIGKLLDSQTFRQHKQVVDATQITGNAFIDQCVYPVKCVSREQASLVLGMSESPFVVFVAKATVAVSEKRLAFL